MATLIPELRAELEAARGPLLLQIKGLLDLMSVPGISPEARAILEGEIEEHQARKTAMDNVLMGLADLEANGYPASMASDIPAAVRDELLSHEAAIEAALGELHAETEAATAAIELGMPELK